MVKLKTLRPVVSTIKPLVGRDTGEKARDKYRREHQLSKRWLKTSWWLEARQRVLLRDKYRCQWPGCGKLVAGKYEAHVDHIVPHNEERHRFFCPDDGLQVLCEQCHNQKKQNEEIRLGSRERW
jgi:5-methylcytosine-specific restriction endonuclease McrA